MTTAIEFDHETAIHSYGYKAGILAYGGLSYMLGVAGLSTLVLACAGLLPLGALLPITDNTAVATAINILLLLSFGMQHSVMARPALKRWINRHFPQAAQRSHYIWTSGLMCALLVVGWQPIDGILWQTQGTTAIGLWILFGFGWTYLLASTFAISHWDLFGLRQVWLEARGLDYTQVPFKENWMYRYSRHPMMLGVLIGVWALPTMSATQFALSAGLTLYIAVGLYFEERDLIRTWGQRYLAYKARIGLFSSFR